MKQNCRLGRSVPLRGLPLVCGSREGASLSHARTPRMSNAAAARVGPHPQIKNLIEELEDTIEDCKRDLKHVDDDEECERQKAARKGKSYDAHPFDMKRYVLRKKKTDHEEELKLYQDYQWEAAASRISQLPDVDKSGAQKFAQELALELKRCYLSGELNEPEREDRDEPCFHSDIEHALKKLEDRGNQFALDKKFVRERPGYPNLRDPRGHNTNPDFISTKRGSVGYFVIEAKYSRLFSNKAARDRYKGQQADYLSCPDCEGVILIAYNEQYTSLDARRVLREELQGVLDMRAVAVGVVKTDEVAPDPPSSPTDTDEDGGDLSGGELSGDEEEGEDGGGMTPPMPDEAIQHSTELLEGLVYKDGQPDNRLLEVWRCLDAEEAQAGRDRILDQCFFDVPKYMLKIRDYLHDKTHRLSTSDDIPQMLAGGSTQMGKTMFVVIGVCVAKKLQAASVVITHKVAGRNSLANKVNRALDLLHKADDRGQLHNPRCMAYAEKGKSEEVRKEMLIGYNCIVVSDTASQITEAKGSVYRILQSLQRDGSGDGRFIIFMDEADAMLRTEDGSLKLEQAIEKLKQTTSSYRGAQLIVNISATLMPVFLEMARTKAQPRGPVFLTSVPKGSRKEYSGVNQFLPLESEDPEMHPDEKGDELMESRPVFLDSALTRKDSLGINKQVEKIFEDACRNDGGRKKGLVLDISLTRVYAAGSIFEKAEEMQKKNPQMHAVVYCGRGVVVRLAEDFDMQSGSEIDVASSSRSGKVLLPKWTKRIVAPGAGQRGGAWYTTAKSDWGKSIDSGKIIGPGREVGETGRLARVDEVLNALECALEHAGRGNDPIAVFGYTMMARGESFVTDLRVPSHLVLFMTKGASFDLLVQTAGRATFLRRELLESNGWVDEEKKPAVRVLMPKQDYDVVRSYPKLIDLVDEHVRGGKTLQELFGDESVFQDLELLKELSGSHRHGFGDKRKNYPTKWWMGSQEAGSGDRESLDDVLTRLRLPKRAEKIWYDYAQERTWYECKVVKVRFKEDGNGDEPTADDVEYLLRCTDDSVVNLDEWLVLDADGSHWKRHKEEIGHGHKKHERWALEEKTKIQKVVVELLREKRGAWMTAKGIEDLLKEAAESGTTTYCGLSGDALRHCLRADDTLCGEILQKLGEREQKIQRRPRQTELSNFSATVAHADVRGEIRDLSALPSTRGPDIEIGDGSNLPASEFTKKTRVWPSHLMIVEQPVGKQLLEPVSYEDFVGSSKYSFDSSSVAPQGLFEYSYDTRAATTGKQLRRQPGSADNMSAHIATAAPLPGPSAEPPIDSPARKRKGGAPVGDVESGGRLSSRQREKRACGGTTAPIDLTRDETSLEPNDMRILIDEIGASWPTLIKLLEKGNIISPDRLRMLETGCDVRNEDGIPKDLRRACIDSCQPTAAPSLEWAHLFDLPKKHLVQLCQNAGVMEDDLSKKDMEAPLKKEIERRRRDKFKQ